jgi:uncharacterized protein YjbJ (UPF0337 family)
LLIHAWTLFPPRGSVGRLRQGYQPTSRSDFLSADRFADALRRMIPPADRSSPAASQLASHPTFHYSGEAMNWDRIEGNWKQLKGKIREQWGRLTDDEFDKIAGKREKLAGSLQESYGIARDEAEKQIKDFEDKVDRNKWVQ